MLEEVYYNIVVFCWEFEIELIQLRFEDFNFKFLISIQFFYWKINLIDFF